MNIKKLKIKNFCKFSDFEIEFDQKITRLIGLNGAGKTTVGINALWACLKGISKNGEGLPGERFRFIGPTKASSDIEIILFDEVKNANIIVKNHITSQSNKITFEAPDGYDIDENWLKNLLSVAFLSRKNFTALSSKEQALLLGIDVSIIDEKIKSKKNDFTLINRELKSLGDVVPVDPVEKVVISDLIKTRNDIDQFNRDQEEKRDNILKHEKLLLDLQTEEKELEEKLIKIKDRIKTGKEKIENLDKPLESKDLSEIDAKIENAEKINDQAVKFYEHKKRKALQESIVISLEKNKEDQKVLQEERTKLIKSHDFGFTGLTVNENGELLLNERPIKEPYFSKGELELIVARLYKSKNPDLKVRFLDDFESLDENNQEKIIKELIDDGFQIITSEVGEKSDKDNVVILRECRILNDGDKNNLL